MIRILLFTILLYPFSAWSFFTDLNVFYISDSLSTNSESAVTRAFSDGSLNMALDRGGYYVIGWSLLAMSATDSATNEVNFSSLDMGPRFGYYFDRDKAWSIFLTYNLKASAKYSAGSQQALWRGTSYKIEVGFAPKIADHSSIGLKLNFYSTNLTEEFVNTTEFSEISNSRTVIWPSLYYAFHFN